MAPDSPPEPEPETDFPCPSCGFLVFGEPPGSFDICGFCDWEDDHVQLRFPTMGGGANKESLVAYQRRAIQRWPLTVQTLDGIPRDPRWRPWEPADAVAQDRRVPGDGLSYFEEATVDDAVPYYWRR